MPQNKIQIIAEKEALDVKREALGRFLASDEYAALPLCQQSLLYQQKSAMDMYADILAERIYLFAAPC